MSITILIPANDDAILIRIAVITVKVKMVVMVMIILMLLMMVPLIMLLKGVTVVATTVKIILEPKALMLKMVKMMIKAMILGMI